MYEGRGDVQKNVNLWPEAALATSLVNSRIYPRVSATRRRVRPTDHIGTSRLQVVWEVGIVLEHGDFIRRIPIGPFNSANVESCALSQMMIAYPRGDP